MNYFKGIGLLAFLGIIVGCGSRLPDSYHMDKKYWNVTDYEVAIRYMKYTLDKEEGYPRLSDPITAPVFKKLIDKQNVSVILEDENLGIKHRDKVADGFWDASRDILELYQGLDIQDKFVYPMELVKAIDFFLYTQLLYFKIGNQEIINETVDPNDPDVQRIVKTNQQSIVNNFNNHLDFLAKESAYSTEALDELVLIIGRHYSQLLIDYPNSKYTEMKRTIKLLIDKCESVSVDKELTKLLTQIEQLKK